MGELDFNILQFKFLLYLIIVFSAVFHEYMHAWTANFLGDPTAKYAGRLTLNPLAHLDPLGTVIIPLMLLFFFGGFIGWAKPVPYNPYNLRNQRRGPAFVAGAGPATNFFLALVFGLFLRFSGYIVSGGNQFLLSFFSILPLIIYINIFLGLFNLLPFPPLDGSKFFASYLPKSWQMTLYAFPFGIFLAIFIAILILPMIANSIYWLIVGTPFII